jgi:hypothetical protein
MRNTPQDTVRCHFYAPIEKAKEQIASRRRCPEFSDDEFIEAGVGRVIADVRSGRDWVQQLQMWMNSGLSVSNFFHSLRSQRRLRFLREVADCVRQHTDDSLDSALDPLAAHPELRQFAVYGSDGHYEDAAAHAPRPSGDREAAGYFFSINLRSHSLDLLDVARPVRKREHDMTALKRLGSTVLRMGEPKGVKVIHVYDPAGIDYAQWFQWKAKGVYFISREKSNSTAETVGTPVWDRRDPRNTGILSDELIGVFCGHLMRRVRYRDPATNREFSFMTNEMTLPPGLIAFLYKLRWDIEKVFDEKKNKLQEKKAWATSPVARCQQALFVCLAHNLMLIFERCLRREHDISDEKVQAKRQQRVKALLEELRTRGTSPNPLILQCSRATQRSLQFIRWLRHSLLRPTSYAESLTFLRPLMQEYLA